MGNPFPLRYQNNDVYFTKLRKSMKVNANVLAWRDGGVQLA